MPRIPRVRRTPAEIAAASPTVTERKVLLAAPRGYCAGVDRAVVAVEKALEHYGPPVYVRKQIVHNLHVVSELESRGAIFVEENEDEARAAARHHAGRRRTCLGAIAVELDAPHQHLDVVLVQARVRAHLARDHALDARLQAGMEVLAGAAQVPLELDCGHRSLP